MSRKFITQRELNFISNITKELVQDVVEQEVKYYAIEVDRTQVHRLYDEAVNKVWSPPVKINALVLYDNPSVSFGLHGADDKTTVEVYFHLTELRDRNVKARNGDFIEYGDQFFEILSATEPQIVFGQINNKVMVKCICSPAREGQFQAGSVSSRGVDNAVPVENTPGVPLTNPISTDATWATNPLAEDGSTIPRYASPFELPHYTYATRPPASNYSNGYQIYNDDSEQIETSDGEYWRDPDGYIS